MGRYQRPSESTAYRRSKHARTRSLHGPGISAGAAAAPILESHACAYRVDLRSEAVRSAMVAVLLVVEQVLLLEYTLTDSVRVGRDRRSLSGSLHREAQRETHARLVWRRYLGDGGQVQALNVEPVEV